jgi:hypothetical protein
MPARIENGKTPAHRQAMTAALEIRLRRHASFQEKLRQLVGKYATKRAPMSALSEVSQRRIRGEWWRSD